MVSASWLARSTPERAIRVRALAGGHCVVFLGKTLYSHGASRVSSLYGNRDKLRPDGPLGPNADFTLPFTISGAFRSLCIRTRLGAKPFNDICWKCAHFQANQTRFHMKDSVFKKNGIRKIT